MCKPSRGSPVCSTPKLHRRSTRDPGTRSSGDAGNAESIPATLSAASVLTPRRARYWSMSATTDAATVVSRGVIGQEVGTYGHGPPDHLGIALENLEAHCSHCPESL